MPDIAVAPRAGAWIETWNGANEAQELTSLPVRERGLKLQPSKLLTSPLIVAPRAGAWIETPGPNGLLHPRQVAPRAGAWIETGVCGLNTPLALSLPVRERGLKLII